jgi:hypothetical protein
MQASEDKDKDISNVERDEWNAEELNEQSPYLQSDEVQRQMLRGDETEGKPDDRDVVGSNESKDTAQGRREAKRGDESRDE